MSSIFIVGVYLLLSLSTPVSLVLPPYCLRCHTKAIRRFHQELVSCDQSCDFAKAPAGVIVNETSLWEWREKK